MTAHRRFFIVGRADPVVVRLKREAIRLMPLATELTIVVGATHFLKSLERWTKVTRLTCDWFGALPRGPREER